MSVPEQLASASSATETAIEQFMDGRTLPLYRMMGYHLGWVDENGEHLEANRPLRFRGALCLLAAGAAGAAGAAMLGAGAAVDGCAGMLAAGGGAVGAGADA